MANLKQLVEAIYNGDLRKIDAIVKDTRFDLDSQDEVCIITILFFIFIFSFIYYHEVCITRSKKPVQDMYIYIYTYILPRLDSYIRLHVERQKTH